MIAKSVDFEDVVSYISESFRNAQLDSNLTDPQIAVLRAGWEDLQYDELTLYYSYKAGYLRRIASVLWTQLTTVFATEITKRNFRQVLENLYKSKYADTTFKESVLKQTIFGRPPLTQCFYGRQDELRLISKSIDTSQCICLYGAKGIGKTSLAAKLFHQARVVKTFDVSIWHHSNSESVAEDLGDLLNSVYGKAIQQPEKSFFDYLKQNKALVILDGIENWMDNLKAAEKFLKKVVELDHKSLVILTSSEPIKILQDLEANKRAVSNIQVKKLFNDDAIKILGEYDLQKGDADKFITSFEGNPYLIHRACARVRDLFGGNIDEFDSKTSFAGILFRPDYESIFRSPNSQIGNVEKYILSFLAKSECELPVKSNLLISELEKQISYSKSEIENSIEILRSHSLIEFISKNGSICISIPRYFIKYIKRNSDIFSYPVMKEIIS